MSDAPAMTDIQQEIRTRTPEEITRQDRWQQIEGQVGSTAPMRIGPYTTPVRVLPWPRRGVDGVPEYAPEPPGMDEVWPGREMHKLDDPNPSYVYVLEGSRPVWSYDGWDVLVRNKNDRVYLVSWSTLRPIPTKTTLTITTDDPDAVREALKTLKGVEVEG